MKNILKKMYFSLKWQARPVCFFKCYGIELNSAFEDLTMIFKGLFGLLLSVIIIPLFPLYHLIIYPIYVSFKMNDNVYNRLSEKLKNSQNEAL